jgi:hypothetical protein
MSDFNSVLSDANRLSVSERIQLIESLWSQTVPWEQIRADAHRRAGLTE